MASRGERIEPRRPAPRLYLVTPQVADPAGLADALRAALAAGDVAAVLLRLDGADERTLTNHAKTIAPLVQRAGVALLLDGHPGIAARAGADGAHLAGIEAFEAALPALKPDRIAGCGGLESRHDAMVAGEAGADYVLFGEPDAAGERPDFEAIEDRVAWWAEVFEIPCVGYASTPGEVAPLAAAGADFIALGDWVFADPRGPAAPIAEASGVLASSEPVG
jgi:thiamine-phosphate pyrophosphorylase